MRELNQASAGHVKSFSNTACRGTVKVERWWQVPLSQEGREPKLHPRRHRVYRLVEDSKHSPREKLELILTQTVAKLGGRGNTVFVKKSLGRNKLLPEGLAVYASPENKQRFEEERRMLREGKPEERVQTRTGELTVAFLKQCHLEVGMKNNVKYELTKEIVCRTLLRKPCRIDWYVVHCIVSACSVGKSAVLQRSIAAKIRAQLAVPWIPPSCRAPLLCRSQEYKSRKRQRLQKRLQDQLRHCVQQGPDSQHALRSSSDLADVLRSFSGGAGGRDVLTKGTRFTHTEKFTFTQEPEKVVQQMQTAADALPASKQSEQDIQARQEEEVTSLQQELDQLSSRVEEVTSDMKKLTVSMTQVSDELKQRELGNCEEEESVRVKKRTIELLPDAENNLPKLQVLVEGSAKRIVNLASQWEKHRAPLIEECRKLKELWGSREVTKP
ncbi:UNVERIFIED_CONTAM: hypothetical protein FKN15_041325 [Acipenser sinensis]